MSKSREAMARVRAFFADVAAEAGKCTWPERQELLESTVVVIVSVLLLSIFVGISDKVLITLLRLLIRTG